jgi:hypothetical protein
MSEGVFRTYIVPLTDTSGEDPPGRVWRGCLLCYELIPSIYIMRGKNKMNTVDKEKFVSCSHYDIRSCIRFRINEIREIRKFMKDENTFKYKLVRNSMVIKLAILKMEIKHLWKIRKDKLKHVV